ncbi:MAG: DUF72 domain-containing protein [Sandaracinaceae bacterium]
MPRIHAGACLDRPPGSKYLEALAFAELALVEPLPRSGTLRRWAEALPDHLTLSVVLPRSARFGERGPLRPDAAMEEAVARAREAAAVLGARFVVLPTGGEITTGQRDRELLAAFAARFRDGPQLVWAPTGLWEPETALPFARRIGVLWGFDPLEADPPPGPVAYARLRAIGMRSRFSETTLVEVVDRLDAAEAEDVWVALESATSFREARRLAELVPPDGS